MQSITDRKMCDTCEYWSGKREPVFDRHAICNKQDYRFADENRGCQQCCTRYSK